MPTQPPNYPPEYWVIDDTVSNVAIAGNNTTYQTVYWNTTPSSPTPPPSWERIDSLREAEYTRQRGLAVAEQRARTSRSAMEELYQQAILYQQASYLTASGGGKEVKKPYKKEEDSERFW